MQNAHNVLIFQTKVNAIFFCRLLNVPSCLVWSFEPKWCSECGWLSFVIVFGRNAPKTCEIKWNCFVHWVCISEACETHICKWSNPVFTGRINSVHTQSIVHIVECLTFQTHIHTYTQAQKQCMRIASTEHQCGSIKHWLSYRKQAHHHRQANTKHRKKNITNGIERRKKKLRCFLCVARERQQQTVCQY